MMIDCGCGCGTKEDRYKPCKMSKYIIIFYYLFNIIVKLVYFKIKLLEGNANKLPNLAQT